MNNRSILEFNYNRLSGFSGHLLTWTLLLTYLSTLLIGCTPVIDATPTQPLATATPQPTPTSTPAPLGSPDNPLVMAIVQADPSTDWQAMAAELSSQLSVKSGFSVLIKPYVDYPTLLEEMRKAAIHLAWLPPITYLWAHQQGIADVSLLTNHFGVFAYGVQFLVNSTSDFTIFYDPDLGASLGDAATALGQLADKRPCWVEKSSIAGFILPAGILAKNGIPTLEGVITQSHTAVVRALYVTGICDFGVTFTISGDPRTATEVLADLPDALQRVVILWRSEAVIPNLNLSLLPDLAPEKREAILFAVQDIVAQNETRQWLSQLLNFEIQAVKPVTDATYDDLRQAVAAIGVDILPLLGK